MSSPVKTISPVGCLEFTSAIFTARSIFSPIEDSVRSVHDRNQSFAGRMPNSSSRLTKVIMAGTTMLVRRPMLTLAHSSLSSVEARSPVWEPISTFMGIDHEAANDCAATAKKCSGEGRVTCMGVALMPWSSSDLSKPLLKPSTCSSILSTTSSTPTPMARAMSSILAPSWISRLRPDLAFFQKPSPPPPRIFSMSSRAL
ncbi:hypothetical protein D3C85_533720 [compost metagenome]